MCRSSGVAGAGDGEFQNFLRAIDMLQQDAFESMLEQVIEAFTLKIGQILAADASPCSPRRERRELWSKWLAATVCGPSRSVSPATRASPGTFWHGPVLNVPMPIRSLCSTRRRSPDRLPHAYHPLRAVLDRQNRVTRRSAPQQEGERAFDTADERQLIGFCAQIAVVLESWRRMHNEQVPTAGQTSD